MIAMSVAGMFMSVAAFADIGADLPVLTVGNGDPGQTKDWTRGDLQALPQYTIKTTTKWTEGVQIFVGPTLQDVLAVSDADGTGGTIRAVAANGYFVNFPMAEIGPDFPIVAVTRNGAYYDLRNNGPLWIVYPYDADRQFRTELILSRSIWQLVSINVID